MAKKAAAKKAAKKAAAPRRHRARVRMYRSGLGDCFLITFFDPKGGEVHMLVDCGSLGAKTTGVKLKDAVADIRTVTKDHLHLLVATHEHKDHVCGFRDVKKAFQDMKVDRVWMAWTENPKDKDAQDLQMMKGDLGQALALAAHALSSGKNSNEESVAMGRAITSLLGFAGEPMGAAAGKKPKKLKDELAKTIDEAMTFVRTGLGVEARYLDPGEIIEEAWSPGFRFYVLGPPRSEAKLNDMGEHGSEDIYGLGSALQAAAAFRAAAGMPDADQESEMPFDRRFRFTETDPLIRQNLRSYFSPGNAWRRVDHDWMHVATDLALQLDKFTNNTSLVLAIERLSDGKVLLFPADAQQGNWLSWHDDPMKFTVNGKNGMETRTAKDLLHATVFYKVGHHGSHNATGSRMGLELMKQKKELVAFIPVDRDVALTRNPKGTWRMPAFELYRTLLDKCEGRVARSDLGWADDAANAANKTVEKELKGLADGKTWTKWKKEQARAKVNITPLYIDFELS